MVTITYSLLQKKSKMYLHADNLILNDAETIGHKVTDCQQILTQKRWYQTSLSIQEMKFL